MGLYVPTRFFAGSLANSSANNNLYTVPAGKTAIVTNVNFAPSGPQSRYHLFLRDDGNYGGCLGFEQSIGQTLRQYRGFYVVPAGGIMQLNPADAASCWIGIHGLLGEGKLTDGSEPMSFTRRQGVVGGATIYTVPAGRTFILKSVVIANLSDGNMQYGVRAGATPVAPWYGALAPYETKQYDLDLVMPAGENLTVDMFSGGAPGINFYASGVLL